MRARVLIAIALCLLPLLSTANATENCENDLSRLRVVAKRYSLVRADLRAITQEAARVVDTQESRLRLHRRFAAGHRHAEEGRAQLLEVFKALLDGACPRVERADYDQTVNNFASQSASERVQLEAFAAAARSLSSPQLGQR